MPLVLAFHTLARRQFMRLGSAAVAGLLPLAFDARAQALIEQLRIICGAAAGSTPDIVARRLAEQLNGRHTKTALVDNRPGAAGRIAINALKQAPADGSVLMLGGIGASALHPLLSTAPGYDPVVDLLPVSLVAEMPLALAVGPAVPGNVGNMRELVDWLRANPSLANVGSPGVGSVPHLLETMLLRDANVAWQHIAYSGGAPAVVAMLGGQIAALVLPEAVLAPHRAAGRLRVLATSGAQRSRLMTDVPNFVEQGHRNLVVQEWFGIFMSARVPAAIIESTSQAIQQAVARPELEAAFAESGMIAASSTPAVLAARISAEQRIWEPLIRAAGIRSE